MIGVACPMVSATSCTRLIQASERRQHKLFLLLLIERLCCPHVRRRPLSILIGHASIAMMARCVENNSASNEDMC